MMRTSYKLGLSLLIVYILLVAVTVGLSLLDFKAILLMSILYGVFVSGLLFWLFLFVDIDTVMKKTIEEYSNDGVLITNKKNHIIYANETFLKQSGYTMADIHGKNPRIFRGELKEEHFYEMMWNELLKNDYFVSDFWDKKKNGVLYLKNIKFHLIRNMRGKPKYFLSVQTDITDFYKLRQECQKYAQVEDTTNLPNRNRLYELVENRVKKNKKFYLIFIRIMNQHHIRHAFPQSYYDEALINYTDTVREILENESDIAEYDKETLVIIVPQSSINKKECLRILEDVSKGLYVNDEYITFENKYGLSEFPKDAQHTEGIIENSMMALYTILDRQRKFNTYKPELSLHSTKENKIQTLLHSAIKNDEFSLVYQPQTNIKSGKIIGFEALIRWSTPLMENIGPAEFIPIAERYGYISTITDIVVDKVVETLDEFIAYNDDIKIAINLSPIVFNDRDWIQRFIEKIERLNIGKHIEIEITEGFLIEDLNYAANTLSQFKSQGMSIAIDDFGSGFSSLRYLRILPIDKLKIDKIFIANINNQDKNITPSIIQLGKDIGALVLGEGVETLEQFNTLKQYGCDAVQGYFIARPMVQEDAIKLLK